ncbi:MAG TPA: O-antigen ligase family protein [Usitatibacter sp.]|nr:O-antigen ligase family protein [Usitatibacter sp.]
MTLPSLHRAMVGFLCAFLGVLPFTSSVALRNVALTAAALCGLAWLWRRRAAWRAHFPAARLLLPIACWSAWSIASVGWSVDPAYSLSELRPGLLPTFGAFLLFFAATEDYTVVDAWALALAAGLAVLALAAIGQQAVNGSWDAERWHVDRGYYSTHVVLALPMLGWLWLRQRSRAAHAVLVAIALGTLLVTFWTDNRIVWVALALMAAFAASVSIRHGTPLQRRWVARVAMVAVGALAALFIAAIQQRHEIQAQPELVDDPRLEIWGFAVERIAERPWVGHGYGRGILRDALRGISEGPQKSLHWHAHNLFLGVALQLGLVGLALFLWMWIAIARELLRGLACAPPHRWAGALGITLLMGFAVKNLTDDFLVRHLALLAWALLGALLGALRGAPRG